MSKIDQAFQLLKRSNFLPLAMKPMAGLDSPLPIGHNQTNSQPSTVGRMLEWLDPRAGDRVLDVGSGSGWTTALLSYIVGPKGSVYAVEKVPELVEFGRRNNKKAGVKNVRFFKAGEVYGLPEYAPFDRILVSASADELPEVLLGQLKTGGKLVVPVKNDILEIFKTKDGKYETTTHSGFVFVPLIKN